MNIKKQHSGYIKLIMKECKVDADEAQLIEEVIRESCPTLDHLTHTQLTYMAARAKRVLEEPGMRALYSELYPKE